MTPLKKKLFSLMVGGGLVSAAFLYCSAPVNSVSTVTLSGTAGSAIQLSAGAPNGTPLTSAPGISDGSFTPVATDTADGFNDAVNFGTLTNGDGTNSTARVAFRERGNSSCHVSCSVGTYTATNISYNGTALTGSTTSASQLTFVGLGSVAATAGAQGSTAGFSYGPRFTSGTDTLATLNSGTMGAVSTTSDKFVSFTSKPSLSGGLTSTTNYVEDTATFAVPTGLAWASTGAGSAWSATVQFAIFSGP